MCSKQALLLLTYSPHRRSTSAPVCLATGRSPPPLFTQKPPQHRSADTEQRSAATAAWKAECFLSGCFMIILDNQILMLLIMRKTKTSSEVQTQSGSTDDDIPVMNSGTQQNPVQPPSRCLCVLLGSVLLGCVLQPLPNHPLCVVWEVLMLAVKVT